MKNMSSAKGKREMRERERGAGGSEGGRADIGSGLTIVAERLKRISSSLPFSPLLELFGGEIIFNRLRS